MKLNPVEPPWYATRMPGGVGGVAPRGVPLSRSNQVDDIAKATATHDASDYQAALKLLGDGADRDIRIVEGVT